MTTTPSGHGATTAPPRPALAGAFLQGLADQDFDALTGTLGVGARLRALLPKVAPEQPAVVLFTSGSEKAPKAVPLTHRNLLSNQRASLSVLGLTRKDRAKRAATIAEAAEDDETARRLYRSVRRVSRGDAEVTARLVTLCERAELYAELSSLTGSPVVELNRAVAVAEVAGPEAALELVDRLDLGSYRYLHSTRADFLRRLGRGDSRQLEAALASDAFDCFDVQIPG